MQQEKESILHEIELDQNKFTVDDIKTFIKQGKISELDLINKELITEKALKIYLNPPTWGEEQTTWLDLNELPEGNTDIYFFGIPRSGKSSIIAGLLYESNEGMLTLHTTLNKKGVRYANDLMNSVSVGYVPPPTNEWSLNYIPCTLHYENRQHSISIIEMSGEFFKRTYENANLEAIATGGKEILKNNNRKLIFFVVDYFKDIQGINHSDVATQGQIINDVLEQLKSSGILQTTDSIQLILSKCDLMSEETDCEEQTVYFLLDNYAGVIANINRVNDEFGINKTRNYNLVVHPFSLGKFMMGKTFIYNGKYSRSILNSILNLTSHRREENWYTKLLNKIKKFSNE